MDEQFTYTKDQAVAIYQALKKEGLKGDWPRYRDAITRSVQAALFMAKDKRPLPYASQAARQLDKFVNALANTVQQYHALGPVLQSNLNSHLAEAALTHSLLMDSLLDSERPVAERLLLSGRFPHMLNIVQGATTLAAASLRHAGRPMTVSKAVLDMLPPTVAAIVARNVSRPRRDGLFPVTGAPKDRAIRYAVLALWPIYDEATGKSPKIYSTAYGKDRYAGGFYAFAAAALGPARLVNNKVLGSNILSAYNEFRHWLNNDQPKKKVKTPR